MTEPEDGDDPRYVICHDCKVSAPFDVDFDWHVWLKLHPGHAGGNSDRPYGQSSLF